MYHFDFLHASRRGLLMYIWISKWLKIYFLSSAYVYPNSKSNVEDGVWNRAQGLSKQLISGRNQKDTKLYIYMYIINVGNVTLFTVYFGWVAAVEYIPHLDIVVKKFLLFVERQTMRQIYLHSEPLQLIPISYPRKFICTPLLTFVCISTRELYQGPI